MINPLLACWLTAMLLILLTPIALLFDVALWRVVVVLVFEVIMLATIGWLRQ
jgi:hypothetical protein